MRSHKFQFEISRLKDAMIWTICTWNFRYHIKIYL